jgi:predicted transcriptional regulator
MIDFQQADLEVGKIYDLIKQQRNGITLQEIAARYLSRDAAVPYAIAQLLTNGKIKTEQRGDTLFCVVVEA